MWLYAIYCVGVFNACQGVYATESNPTISFSIPSREKCQDEAITSAKQLKARFPDKDIRWKCVDYSDNKIKEDK